MASDSLLNRIQRLESLDAIRQLASRYAVALDAHDMNLLTECFVPDVRVGSLGVGRDALKRDFDRRLRARGYCATTHFVGNHLIELLDADRAMGVVYCRAEHEFMEKFVVGAMQYFDEYERIDERWYFRRRRPKAWYFTDVLDRPVGERRLRWPDDEPAEAELPTWWPSWTEFWGADEEFRQSPVPEAGPDETFLRRLRPPPIEHVGWT